MLEKVDWDVGWNDEHAANVGSGYDLGEFASNPDGRSTGYRVDERFDADTNAVSINIIVCFQLTLRACVVAGGVEVVNDGFSVEQVLVPELGEISRAERSSCLYDSRR